MPFSKTCGVFIKTNRAHLKQLYYPGPLSAIFYHYLVSKVLFCLRYSPCYGHHGLSTSCWIHTELAFSVILYQYRSASAELEWCCLWYRGLSRFIPADVLWKWDSATYLCVSSGTVLLYLHQAKLRSKEKRENKPGVLCLHVHTGFCTHCGQWTVQSHLCRRNLLIPTWRW